MKEWDSSRNKKHNPYLLTSGSGEKVWWRCSKVPEHRWMTTINLRNRGRNCPYCSGNKICITNCLAAVNPKLASEWHPTKNGKLTPWNVLPNSRRKVWWKCKNGHEWQACIYSRNYRKGFNTGVGCAYCSNRKVSITNCLATVNPDLAAEWHPTKNKKLTPYDVTYLSSLKLWWKCKNNHAYLSSVAKRNRGDDCPCCRKIILKNGKTFDSFVEAHYYLTYLTKKEVIFRHPYGNGMYCDFYIPKENRYIEVTSFNEKWVGWKKYFKKIQTKKKIVSRQFGKFEFVQVKLLPKDILNVRKYTVNYKDYDIDQKGSILRNRIALFLCFLRKYKTYKVASLKLGVPNYFFGLIISQSKIYKKYIYRNRRGSYIYRDKKRNKWVVRVKQYFLGRFDHKEDAILAVKKHKNKVKEEFKNNRKII
jgi:hypothetical protein